MEETAQGTGGDAAAPSPANPSQAHRGTNQAGVRLYNERLILSLIRRHRSLTRVEIARLTGLSLQTTTVVINRLEADGLLVAGERQRGRVGQPAVPFSFNPDGAFGFGMMLGRRSCDVVLMDMVAEIRARRRITYAYPEPAALMGFAEVSIAELLSELGAGQRARIAGLGIAMPFELWNWETEMGVPAGALGAWRQFDIAAALSAAVAPWPVQVWNDGTAACAAELTFGRGGAYGDFAYFYVGAFIGGGIVLNGSLFPGRSGNAGALGSMPILRRGAEGGASLQQLIRCASIHRLERQLVAAGQSGQAIWLSPNDWSGFAAPLDAWIDEAAEGLAQAIAAVLSVIDFEAVVIDGAFPTDIRHRLVERTRDHFAAIDRQGLTEAAIMEGRIGRDARAIGAAALPLLANFGRDFDVLFKER